MCRSRIRIDKLKVLVFCDYYLPGYKAGGPVRALEGLVESLGDEFAFDVVTRDRDAGDENPYPALKTKHWHRLGKGSILYLEGRSTTAGDLYRIVRERQPNILYLNSFFSPVFTMRVLALRRLGLLSEVPVVIAPRGELATGALGLKGIKKRIYLKLARFAGLYRRLKWQASGEHELKDIQAVMGSDTEVSIAPDLFVPSSHAACPSTSTKQPGSLKAVFLSRVVPVKNLLAVLQVLPDVKGDVELDVYGPLEDEAYWERCEKLVATMPGNVVVRYCGVVRHECVSTVLSTYDVFVLPTLGENFGHAILEALESGCPVLISDRTQWRNLRDAGVGWDLPLEQPDLLRKAMQVCVDMDAPAHDRLSRQAAEYAARSRSNETIVSQNRLLFSRAGAN